MVWYQYLDWCGTGIRAMVTLFISLEIDNYTLVFTDEACGSDKENSSSDEEESQPCKFLPIAALQRVFTTCQVEYHIWHNKEVVVLSE